MSEYVCERMCVCVCACVCVCVSMCVCVRMRVCCNPTTGLPMHTVHAMIQDELSLHGQPGQNSKL